MVEVAGFVMGTFKEGDWERGRAEEEGRVL